MSAMWQKLGASTHDAQTAGISYRILPNMVVHAQTSNSKTSKNPSLIPLKPKSLFFNPYGFRT
jgi:hypothetical protein